MLKIIGFIILTIAAFGIFSGKIMAGSRGLRAHYYSRVDHPFLYYCFIIIYTLIGAVILYNA